MQANRSQTDNEILAALQIEGVCENLRVDRTDPYGYLVVGSDPAGTEGIIGRAVLEEAQPGARRWYLGCVECWAEPEETGLKDGGQCPSCRLTEDRTQAILSQ